MNTAPILHCGDMPPEEFRAHAHNLADWIADYFSRLDDIPVLPDVQPGEVRARLPQRAPERGESVHQIFHDFQTLIAPNLTQWNNPNFFAYFANSASGIAVLAEFLAAALNNNSMVWKSGQAATELEQTVVRWLAELLGLESSLWWGMIFDTASTGTMQALACAREQATARLSIQARSGGLAGATMPRLRVYASEMVHSSIDKACITLGIGTDNLVKIPVNDRLQMIPEELERALASDKAAGCLPTCVVGVIGTTSAGSSDSIEALANICARERLWLHVDAAWAGPAAMLEEWRDRFLGWERADSIVINPHKWLFVPMDLSILYTRSPEILKQAFSIVPEYLKTSEDDNVEHMMDYGLQLGRRFRSLKLWFVLRYFGKEGIVARLREHIALAQLFARLVEEHPDFELCAPVEFALVCFRFKPSSLANADEYTLEQINARLEERVNASRAIFIVHTKLRDIYTLRFTVGNLHTREDHVRQAFAVLVREAQHVL